MILLVCLAIIHVTLLLMSNSSPKWILIEFTAYVVVDILLWFSYTLLNQSKRKSKSAMKDIDELRSTWRDVH
jgi:succinate dehydrogenase hydrophobic anchor subunit